MVASGGAVESRQPGTAGAATGCREGLATYRIVTKAGALTSTTEGRCTFDRAAVEGTCVNDYADSQGRKYRSISVTRHASVADVVDEVSVVPPRTRSLGTTTTVSGAGPATTSTSTHAYDGQGRLVSTTSEARPAGPRSIVTYTAWDKAGRPTTGAQAAMGRVTPQAFSYDDATRTQTSGNAGVACTQTFDRHGNPVMGVCGGATSATTVLSTQRLCR